MPKGKGFQAEKWGTRDDLRDVSQELKDQLNTYSKTEEIVNKIFKVENLSLAAAKKATEYSIVEDNTPPSIASGSIFMVCNLLDVPVTKKDISGVCGISEVTISKCYKKLLNYHQHLLPENIMNKLYK